jgi:hypothetical protein
MPNTTSASLKLTVQATGENSGTWGQITNTNLLILEQAIGGYAGVALNATTGATLTFSNGALSDGKNQVLKLTGTITTNVDVIVPDSIEKTYVVENATSGAFTVTVKTTSGSGVTWGTTDKGKKLIYSDGTDILEGISSIDTLKVSTFTSTGIDDNATSTAITIDSSENVGIGTASPGTALQVEKDWVSDYGSINISHSTNSLGGLGIRCNNVFKSALIYKGGTSGALLDIGTYSAEPILFRTNNSERMRIDSSGKVSIGDTTSSGYRLKIKGTLANDADDQGILLEEAGTGGAFIKYDGAANLLKLGGYNAGEVDSINIVRNTGDVGIGTTAPDAKLSVNGVASFGDGTALLPSIANFGDLNTGMWFPAADTIAFSEGGVEAMRITSAGRLGIGTTAPDAPLEVNSGNGDTNSIFKSTDNNCIIIISDDDSSSTIGVDNDGSGGALKFNTGGDGSYSGNSEKMRITSSGNVGIGTSSPSSQSGDANTLVVGSGSGNKGLTIYSGTTSNGAIRFSDGTSGADTYRGQIDYDHNDNSLKFVTDTSERMRIDSSGNVGIGTTSPNSYAGQTALTINSSGVARVDLDVSDTIVGTLTGESTYVGLFSQGASTTLRLGTNNTERMRIDSSGNVGIGTSSPTARLSVADSKTGTEASPHLVILGNGYTGNHWLDTSAYYIGQNSNARLLRIYSGSNEAVGVELGVGATSFGTYSDERLKKDITDLTNGLNKILALRPVNFKYKSDADDYRNRIGIIAQSIVGQVDEALDETKITADDETQYYNVRYQDLIPVLVKGIQEQQTQIQELEAKITALETNQP